MQLDLWNSTTGTWDLAAVDDNGTWSVETSNTTTFYPDAVCQIWPIALGMEPATSAYATGPWNAFASAWPNWDTDQVNATYPWPAMARAAQVMGDTTEAATLLSTMQSKYAPLWPWPWYNGAAGWFLRAATH
jgi:hypothetical protein